MNIRDQIAVLNRLGVEYVVVGGQAGVLREAIEFSHDLDVLIRATEENAARLVVGVREVTTIDVDASTLLGRDFQQYISPVDGTELDVHLKLIELPDYAAAVRSSSVVDFLGELAPTLELTALYASKRTDRPRDAVHRRAIEDRLARLVLDGAIVADETVLACCLDARVARLIDASELAALAASTRQPLLQARLLALGGELEQRVCLNPAATPPIKALLSLPAELRLKVTSSSGRFAALLAKLALELPPDGHHVTATQ